MSEDGRNRGVLAPLRGLRGLACGGAMLTLLALAAGAFPELEKEAPPIESTLALEPSELLDLERVVAAVADRRVVFVGEQHDRYEHHLVQLEIIRRLHQRDPRLAIGMEFFQQPFQSDLDAFVAGETSEQEMLRATEYYSRWSVDYRHYAPLLQYAREHRLPVVALNVPGELTRKVGREGLDSLTEEERAQLPAEIDRSDTEYEARLSEVFENHPRGPDQGFDQFVEVQLLWDEGMAERAAEYLAAHLETRMVVLAGFGHLAYGSGIPNRLKRRLPVSSAIVLNGWQDGIGPGFADYVLLPEERSLPPAGRIGAMLEDRDEGLWVASCQAESPCAKAGLRKGDQLLSIDGQTTANLADLRLVMWDKEPGDKVSLEIRRKHWILPPRNLELEIELQAVP